MWNQLVKDVKGPLNVGEIYQVPTFVHHMDGRRFVAPLIDHLHNDIENGQAEPHYHVDTRFINYERSWSSKDDWFFFKRVYPHEYSDFRIVYPYLKCYSAEEVFITHPDLISKSKFKHNCIHKGKCPHRGYDLSQVIPVDGVIRCPLHGLQFDLNGKIISSSSSID